MAENTSKDKGNSKGKIPDVPRSQHAIIKKSSGKPDHNLRSSKNKKSK